MPWNAAMSVRAGWIAAGLLCGVAGIAGCSKDAPPPPQQAVDVTAMTIEPRDAPVVYEFVGQTQSQLYFALINLYKALGGGWVDLAEERAPRPEVADRM